MNNVDFMPQTAIMANSDPSTNNELKVQQARDIFIKMNHLDSKIMYIHEPKRIITVAYTTHFGVVQYGATIFRRDVGPHHAPWVKKSHRESALHRLRSFPITCQDFKWDPTTLKVKQNEQLMKKNLNSVQYKLFESMFQTQNTKMDKEAIYFHYLIRKNIHIHGVCHVTEDRRKADAAAKKAEKNQI